jgi:hypothetical protein
MSARAKLLARVGGLEAFASSFNWRTFSPDRRAEQALADAEHDIARGLAAVGDEDLGAEWLEGYLARWAKYQAAGARTANWMITGPARFPVERNRKRMEVEHKRSLELSAFVEGARWWADKRKRIADRAELAAADPGGHVERVVAGVRYVENVVLDRVQLIFPDKPAAEERAVLKAHAFRWAPSLGAWQRQLTANGKRAAESVLAKLAA